MQAINDTHDPALRSWIDSANIPGGDFPVQNLPFGVFRRRGSRERFRGGVAIGEAILDLAAAVAAGALHGPAAEAAAQEHLNSFFALGPAAWTALRRDLSRALREGSASEHALRQCLVPQLEAEYEVPGTIGDYTDFYSSIYHATAVGKLFRPDNPLLPNYKWMPIAYHGRSSSIVISGTAVRRPKGQRLEPGSQTPTLGASQRLDYEVELAAFVGPGNTLGQPVPLAEAEGQIFGLTLLNDWSARDLQSWEYQPLGPFLGKNFATSLSPWIITLEALAPFRQPAQRPASDPPLLRYLCSPENSASGGFDIQMEASIRTSAMREANQPAARLSLTSFRHSYWTLAQMVAHHTVNGCNLRPGDVLGTGTQSGPRPGEAGSLLELSDGGRKPLALPGHELRAFLEDGDEVILRAWCEGHGTVRIGFGEVRGIVQPALPGE